MAEADVVKEKVKDWRVQSSKDVQGSKFGCSKSVAEPGVARPAGEFR